MEEKHLFGKAAAVVQKSGAMLVYPRVRAKPSAASRRRKAPYDLIALTEVRATNADRYETAVENGHSDYHAFTSSTGGSDRMMLFVRSDRFEIVGGSARERTSSGGPSSFTFLGGAAWRPFLVELKD